jgi:hypothetical protein
VRSDAALSTATTRRGGWPLGPCKTRLGLLGLRPPPLGAYRHLKAEQPGDHVYARVARLCHASDGSCLHVMNGLKRAFEYSGSFTEPLLVYAQGRAAQVAVLARIESAGLKGKAGSASKRGERPLEEAKRCVGG